MTGGAAGMHGLDVGTMTGSAVAATGRQTRLQVRHGSMTQHAVTVMRSINRSIFSAARIMTITARIHTESHIPGSNMVNAAVVPGCFVRMTIQAVGGIGTQVYCINDFLPRAVVTGGTAVMFLGVLACPPRSDPVSVLDLRLNLHKGESYGSEDIPPITQFFTTAIIKQGDISFIPV